MRTAGSPRRDTGISGEDTGRKLYGRINMKYLWKFIRFKNIGICRGNRGKSGVEAPEEIRVTNGDDQREKKGDL
jgi:hypothetical protein